MSNTIGLAMNVYMEHNALPGALESASRFYDDIWVIHAGPGGKYSTDGTIEILEQYGVRIIFDKIDDGFGVLRTKLLRAASTEWTMIMDADERFFPWIPEFACSGTGSYPAQEHPDLHRGLNDGCFNQGDLLRSKLANECKEADALRLSRRHWFDLGMHRPCQNWTITEDWQLRILRNKPYVYYDHTVKMHERCLDKRTGRDPVYGTGNTRKGPFFDHFHCFFKPMEKDQRQSDIKIYDWLDHGSGPIPSE
jgi:glycosyltransferase involved in cell wall biosynthesis